MIPSGDQPASMSDMPEPIARYQPGVCNIGSAEIARRRRAGHIGLAATIGLFAGLFVLNVPRPVRLIVALPAAASASGYLQARARFCAGFGSMGVYNFGELGRTVEVIDPDERARDRRKARQIGLGSLAVGIIVGVVAAIPPR